VGGKPPDFVEFLDVFLFKRNYIAVYHCRTGRFIKEVSELGRLFTAASIAFVMCGAIAANESIAKSTEGGNRATGNVATNVRIHCVGSHRLCQR
jgi:hypothetical protein